MDKELIRCLIEREQSPAPRLRYIFTYYLEEMSEPTDLYDLADEHGMEICGLYRTDVIDPPWEALGSDTYGSRNGEVKNWQGFSGGLSPRHPDYALPAVLEARQASNLYNGSNALEMLIPLYVSDWYGPQSTPEDFFMPLATMIVMVSDISYKDTIFNYQSVEKLGYHLNVTNVPSRSQRDYLTNRGGLNLCAHAYEELSRWPGYGINPITDFETTLVWTNGTDLVQQHVLRYEGVRT
ncbi:MAG: hypothetical protein L6R42_002784 [Xanthoria sp. 1 TBL-2021]|nr:MAG: hypothetical protein L6R42_002784 [Xanthoria sp. 1 TBL-2021]